jgi:uncharacterized protein YpiB (UPF0302 family)
MKKKEKEKFLKYLLLFFQNKHKNASFFLLLFLDIILYDFGLL